MALKILRFDDTNTAQHALNGGISGGAQITGGRIMGLHGKTLIFNTPAGTVTFSDPTGAGLSPDDIQTQIQAVHAGLVAQFYRGYLRIIEATPTSGVVLDTDGTANVVFGFGNKVDTTGIVYAPYDGAAPRLLEFRGSPRMDGFIAVVETA